MSYNRFYFRSDNNSEMFARLELMLGLTPRLQIIVSVVGVVGNPFVLNTLKSQLL